MNQARLLLVAVQYFTRIRVPASIGHEQEQLDGATRYFPAIGLLVGGTAALTLWLAAQVLPSPLPAILSVAVTALITGALHEDGLADTFDGLGGGATRERALEIMKDPRIGTFGAIALILVLLLKVTALNAMSTIPAMAALVAAHAYSRFCTVIAIASAPYVGSAGRSRAAPLVRRMRVGEMTLAALFGIAPVILCGSAAIVACVAALVTLAIVFAWSKRRLGGYTGDTLGAIQQLTELTFYLAVLVAWRFL